MARAILLPLVLFALASGTQAVSSNCQAVQPSFPSTFQCSSDKDCISTGNASTAICCDAGSNCTSIAPITCNIQLQNASATSANASQIFTTRLGDTLPSCGTNTCCPFGYTCTNSGPESAFCSMIIAQSSLNGSQSSVSTSSVVSSTVAASSSSPTSSNTIDSSETSVVKKQNSFPPAVFIAGVILGIVIGVLASLTWVVCTGRHGRSNKFRPSQLSSSSKRPIISAPIPFPNNSRTDFIRRAAYKTRSVFSARAADEREQAPPPLTPIAPQQAHRKPSTETIQVYSPPSLVQYPSATVPPLRNMTRQRHLPPPAALDHPFQTPPKSTQTGLAPNDADDGEFLKSRFSVTTRGRDSVDDKRGTTFTTMMAQCGIPDHGDQFPAPKIPAPYETRYRK